MKKLAIALVFVLMLTFCACGNSQGDKNSEKTSANSSSEVSSTDKNESSTLETIEGENEVTIPFEEIEGSTDNSSDKEKTTEKTTEETEESTTQGSYEMPIIPIPQR